MAREAHDHRVRAALGADGRARLAVCLRVADDGRRPAGALSRRSGPASGSCATGSIPTFRRAPTKSSFERTRRRYAEGRPYLLYLGTLEPRKNVEALVAACERLWTARRLRPDLVLAGGIGWKTSALSRRGSRAPPSGTRSTASATRAGRLRGTCTAPRRCSSIRPWPRGSAFPCSRRWHAERRSIASDVPALREVGGDAALYAPPRDPSALARQIERALEDGTVRDRLREAGPPRAALFSWTAAARATAAVLAEAAEEAAP